MDIVNDDIVTNTDSHLCAGDARELARDFYNKYEMQLDPQIRAGAIALARDFHNKYEELAPKFRYTTRKDTRDFDPDSRKGQLMIEVCDYILSKWFVSTLSNTNNHTCSHAWEVVNRYATWSSADTSTPKPSDLPLRTQANKAVVCIEKCAFCGRVRQTC